MDSTSIIDQYTELAYQHAGIERDDWLPQQGYHFNKPVLEKLYNYYRDVYFKSNQHFLWAGLARMTGGQVIYGMNNLTKIARDPCVLTVNIMEVAKTIFENMAWQHELFLADYNQLIKVCHCIDQKQPSRHSYETSWRSISSGDNKQIAAGNKMLLENEQYNTIQPYYNLIKKDNYSARYFWFTKFAMRNIHPYHRRFIFSLPLKDVTVFHHRWQWIDGRNGMWQTWTNLPVSERDRLVALNNDDIILHRWLKK